MKVKDLIQQLQKLDQDLPVYAACENEEVVVPGYLVRPFFIEAVSVANVEMSHDEMRRPEIAAVPEGEGRKCAILDITTVF